MASLEAARELVRLRSSSLPTIHPAGPLQLCATECLTTSSRRRRRLQLRTADRSIVGGENLDRSSAQKWVFEGGEKSSRKRDSCIKMLPPRVRTLDTRTAKPLPKNSRKQKLSEERLAYEDEDVIV